MARQWDPTQHLDWAQNLSWARGVLSQVDRPIEAEPVELFGQDSIRKQLEPFLASGEALPHALLLGEAGIGKTHLARWIAQEKGERFEELICPIIAADLPDTGITLLDEVHRLNKPEWLYPAMEKGELTVLAATTKPELIEPALRTRFFLVLRLTRLDNEASKAMLRSLIEPDKLGDLDILAGAGAGNPRQLQRIAAVSNRVGPDTEAVLSSCRITADGLTETHITYLATIAGVGRPVGVAQLAVLMYLDESTVKEAERLLLERDLIELGTRGRTITSRGRRYLELLGTE